MERPYKDFFEFFIVNYFLSEKNYVQELKLRVILEEVFT